MGTPLDTKSSCEKLRVFALNTSFHRSIPIQLVARDGAPHVARDIGPDSARTPVCGAGNGSDRSKVTSLLILASRLFLSSAFSTKHSSKGHSRTPVVC
jgi:hypothetical protein